MTMYIYVGRVVVPRKENNVRFGLFEFVFKLNQDLPKYYRFRIYTQFG